MSCLQLIRTKLDKMSYTNYNKNNSTLLFTVFGLSTNVDVENKEVIMLSVDIRM